MMEDTCIGGWVGGWVGGLGGWVGWVNEKRTRRLERAVAAGCMTSGWVGGWVGGRICLPFLPSMETGCMWRR